MKQRIATLLALGTLGCMAGCATGPDFSQMSPQQIQAYQYNQQLQMMQMQALMGQAQSGSQQMLNSQQQMLQNNSNYAAPAVQNPSQPNANLRCIQAGIYVSCGN